jgi:hypothetical protein
VLSACAYPGQNRLLLIDDHQRAQVAAVLLNFLIITQPNERESVVVVLLPAL